MFAHSQDIKSYKANDTVNHNVLQSSTTSASQMTEHVEEGVLATVAGLVPKISQQA